MSTRLDRTALLKRERSVLVAIDLQERLAPAIEGIDRILSNTRRLMRAAEKLAVPILVTEHYPAGLGHTVEPVQEVATTARTLEKTAFGALGEAEVAPVFEGLVASGRSDFVLLGTEAHVCMLQTGLQILGRGWPLAVVEDACGSRQAGDKAAATSEMVLFEWLERGATPEFRDLLPLIRDA